MVTPEVGCSPRSKIDSEALPRESDVATRTEPPAGDPVRFVLPAAELQHGCTSVLEAAGAAPDDAALVARSLVDSDTCGHPSHGVLRLPGYLDEMRSGRIDVTARPRVVRRSAATLLFDANWGFGQVSIAEAVSAAVRLAESSGVGLVGVVRSNHCGRLGFWGERIAETGAWGLLCTSYDSGPYEVAPFGGTSASLGTNPIAYAIPRLGGKPVVGDFATSEVAAGKLLVAQQRGEAAPDGAVLDRAGRPTRSPGDFFAGGALRAFGGHKGSALALLVDLLSCGLTDSSSWSGGRDESFASFVLAIAPTVFVGREVGPRVEETVSRVRATRPEQPAHPVELPGEREQKLRAAAGGYIELSAETWHAICAEAERLDVKEVLEITVRKES
jgi:LDH2 family malate/lactate/ureidoglycolate dehydrogenase